MPNQTDFKVTITSMKAVDLPAMDVGGTSDPFVKVNFDNFKQFQTSVKSRELNPVWQDTVSFTYSTRYADCLSRKSVVFEVWDHNTFSSNALIGTVKLDLHTIATGPITHELTIRDGRKVRGTLYVDVLMEQVCETALSISKVGLSGHDDASAGALDSLPDVQLVVTLPASPATVKFGGAQRGASPSGPGALLVSGGWPAGCSFRTEGGAKELYLSLIDFTLISPSSNVVLAAGRLPVSDAFTFVQSEDVDFEVRLVVTAAGAAAGMTQGGNSGIFVSGAIQYSNIPTFAQLTDGIHSSESGIRGVTSFPVPGIPNIPNVLMYDSSGKEITKIPGLQRSKALARAKSDGAALRGVDIKTPIYPPGSGKTPPAASERLFGGVPGLPVCWVRRSDEASGRVAFENLCTGLVEDVLPHDQEFVLTVPASNAGPLGLQMEPNFSGTQRFGIKSGRRNSGYDIGAVVRGCKPESALGATGKLRPGHHLISINGISTTKLTFAQTVDTLKAATRPLVLRFFDPFAVPSALAAQAQKANISERQAMGGNVMIGGRKVDLRDMVRSTIMNGRAGTGAMGAGGGTVVHGRKTVAQAQKTLDLALGLLGKVNVQHNDALAAAAIAAGKHDDPSVRAQKALMDAGFLRTLAATVSGNGGDAAPTAVRERLEAAAKAAADARKREAAAKEASERGEIIEEKKGDEDADEADRDLSEEASQAPTGKMYTSDATAAAAVRAIGHVTSGQTSMDGKPPRPSDVPAIRAMIEARTKRVAAQGVFQRAVASMQQRTAAFAEAAVATVSSLSHVVGAGGPSTSALGLDAQSLIIVSQSTRKHEYNATMAEAVGGLVQSLAAENKDQDGVGFMKLVAECVVGVTGMTQMGYFRAKAPDGGMFYIVPGGGSVWEQPAEVKVVMDKLVALDRAARLIEDAAIINATNHGVSIAGITSPLLTALPLAIEGQQEDPFVVCALLGAAAKLASLPVNAGGLLTGEVLPIVDAVLAAHARDLRMCECVSVLYFNIGRDLDYSDALLSAGAVGKVTALARAYLKHKASWTGSVCAWPPEGREAEVNEAIVLPGTDRFSRDKNTLRPRLVRTCINVLINLACYRRPTSTGATSVDLIVSNRGVELLGEVLLSHITDSSVVTSVLNCAANIAFKNREVQLAIGVTMTDAIVLAGWSFQRDSNLLSMALRAIGNLTNEDANIHRGLGCGVVKMIASAMRLNSSDIALQTLAASVLSNIASTEPTDTAAAHEDLQMFTDAFTVRTTHPAEALRPIPQDVAMVQNLLQQGKMMWQIAPWLLVEEGAVGCLVNAMTRNSTDVSLVEACLRTLLCVAGEEDVTAALIARHDLVSKTLFVMRAADFDVTVQASGATILQVCASMPSTQASVVASDAAHILLSALDNHKASLSGALNSAIGAMSSMPDPANPAALPQAMVRSLDNILDGKAHQVLLLATKVCDTIALVASSRAAKSAIELNSPHTVSSLLQGALSILNVMARRGFAFVAPQSGSRILADVIGFAEASALMLADWVRHPASKATNMAGPDGILTISADEEAACFAARNILTAGNRNHGIFSRVCELCVTGTGEPGSPATLAVTPRVARAILSIPASLIIRGPVLADRAARSDAPGNGGMNAPFLEVDAIGVDGLASSSGVNTLGALLLALSGAVVHYASSAAVHLQQRGTVPFDSAAVTARAAAAQALVLLDIVGSVAAPPQPQAVTVIEEHTGQPVVVMQAPAPGGDAASIASAIVGACAGAIQGATQSYPAFLQRDATPSPLKLGDVLDLSNRSVQHLAARAQAILSGNSSPHAPVATVSEARALFTFSVSRAKSQASVAGVSVGHGGGAPQPQSTSPTAAAGAASMPMAMAAAPPAVPGQMPMAGAAAGGSAEGSGGVGAPTKSLKRMASRKGFIGPLAAGMPATAWIDNKGHEVILRTDEECKDLLLFAAPTKKGAAIDLSSPMAIVPGGAFVAVRIGKPIKDGKGVKAGGGLFSKGPKSDRTVCLDSGAGNTLVQLECDKTSQASELVAACEGLSAIASKLQQ